MMKKYFLLSLVALNIGIANFAQTNIGKSVDSLFTSYLDSSLSGCVLVAEQGRVTLEKPYGYANNETKKLNTINTLFNVASIGKQFTVYAVLQLENQGRIRTSDYLSKYVGSFNDVRDSVTIHDLLTHRSGLMKEGVDLDYSTRNKFIESVKKVLPDSIPGKKYRYSNAGYSMLAAVVEIVSGQSFEKFLLENIFTPFEMKHTSYPWEYRTDKTFLATGYNNKREPVAVQENIWAARGPGNLVTTMRDLFIWMQAFQNDKLTSPDTRNKILYDYFPGNESYAWNKTTTARKTRFFHKGGGRRDFESRLMWFPDDDVIVIFSLNNDYDLARQLFEKIRKIMN